MRSPTAFNLAVASAKLRFFNSGTRTTAGLALTDQSRKATSNTNMPQKNWTSPRIQPGKSPLSSRTLGAFLGAFGTGTGVEAGTAVGGLSGATGTAGSSRRGQLRDFPNRSEERRVGKE